jgi:hypothetical protein
MQKNEEQVVEEDLAPAGFLVLRLNVEIQALQLTIDNEFDQRIVLARIDRLCLYLKKAKDFTRIELTLKDLFIQDLWSGSETYGYLA